MAITDHDWMLEREERIALSAAWGLDLIAGCEFSAGTFINGKPHIIHIGGHWLDEDDPNSGRSSAATSSRTLRAT